MGCDGLERTSSNERASSGIPNSIRPAEVYGVCMAYISDVAAKQELLNGWEYLEYRSSPEVRQHSHGYVSRAKLTSRPARRPGMVQPHLLGGCLQRLTSFVCFQFPEKVNHALIIARLGSSWRCFLLQGHLPSGPLSDTSS